MIFSLFLHDLMRYLRHIENIYNHFLLMGFIVAFSFYPSLRIYIWSTMTQTFYGIFNTINEHNQRQNHHFSLMFPTKFDIQKEVIEKFLLWLFCFMINHDYYVITLWIHYTLFIIVFIRNRFNFYCQLNFPCIRYFKITYDAL